jgi:glycolate oxidase FAD binding subunit
MSGSPLPLVRTEQPTSVNDVAEIIRAAAAAGTPLYPLGGSSSLQYGLTVKEAGVGLSLANWQQVVDFPARDMTITVSAGMPFAKLAAELAKEGQQLPFDPPKAKYATVGGIVATNFNGPRKYGYGGIRDFVIGIEAVDGTGRIFHGGGRVVKNVAGYDFCKLLTGSLGTLGVITQLTFKVRPLSEKTALVAAGIRNESHLEQCLAALSQSATTPAAVEVLRGDAWAEVPVVKAFGQPLTLLVRVEGTAVEVDWMMAQLQNELNSAGCEQIETNLPDDSLWQQVIEFPDDQSAPLVVKAQVSPSGVAPFLAEVNAVDPTASILAHAGHGAVFVKFSQFPEKGLLQMLVGQLQPAAKKHHGSVVVLSNPSGAEMTPQVCWSGAPAGLFLMNQIKKQFDPRNILNRGRFVYVGL